MRRYESIFIIRPDAGESDISEIIGKVDATIANDAGSVIKTDRWGLRKLAYLIKKESQGYYVYIDYAGLPATVKEMERNFKIDDRILKFMTVKLADSCSPEDIARETAKAKSSAPSAEDNGRPDEEFDGPDYDSDDTDE